MHEDLKSLPVIDVTPLSAGSVEKRRVADQIDAACRQSGFFYVVGHGVDADLQQNLQSLVHEFLMRPTAEKMQIEMAQGGKAWRGYFRVGDELTSGQPEQNEGLNFGEELAADHQLVQAGTPLHGPNLFPQVPAAMRLAGV